jgi:hypothetical protein
MVSLARLSHLFLETNVREREREKEREGEREKEEI